MATFDLVTDHERHSGGTVIRAGSVVAHAAAELREHQHDDVVGRVVLPQVCHERVESFGHRGPQLGVQGVLSRVGVEAAVVAVEHPRAETGEMDLGDALQFAGDRGVRDTSPRTEYLPAPP